MRKIALLFAAAFAFAACSGSVVKVDSLPQIYPDYIGTTIPAGIAPLDFNLPEDYDKVYVEVKGSKDGSMSAKGTYADFNIRKWHKLTDENMGGYLIFTVAGLRDGKWEQFDNFPVYVSENRLDDYGVVYRKIAPGYETYSKIGNYQRNIHNFTEDPIIESTLTPGQCVNCHTSNATNPDQYTFHLRGKHGATYFQLGKEHKWVTTKTTATISNSVYPYWHPSGNYCACSNNFIHQSFWTASDRLIEVWDDASDISVVDVRTDNVLTCPLVHTDYYETYPAFSPDGKTLYYCTSYPYPVPAQADEVRYDLCTIGFDAETGLFGKQVDTLIHAAAEKQSVTFPRPSYDGKWLLYTKHDFGCFPIDHVEADLWLMDLESKETWPLENANSELAESFHNWSSNSHWILFSSRRQDGLYSLLYICEIDENGKASKPFLLPQKNPRDYYGRSLYSYNVPDFTLRKVKFNTNKTYKEVVSDERVQATTNYEKVIDGSTGASMYGVM